MIFPILAGIAMMSFAGPGSSGIAEGTQAGQRFEIQFQEIQVGEDILKTSPLAFRWCPSGSYKMGTRLKTAKKFTNMPLYYPDQETLIPVTLSHGFYIGETEVTLNQWNIAIFQLMIGMSDEEKIKLLELEPPPLRRSVIGKDPDLSVEYPISVDRTIAGKWVKYINKHYAPKGWEFRFPTSAEWEYACRAGQTHDGPHQYSYEESVSTSFNKTYDMYYLPPVASKKPNAWGIYDMLGSYWEWTSDYITDLEFLPKKGLRELIRFDGPVTDPVFQASGKLCIRRGGAYDAKENEVRTGQVGAWGLTDRDPLSRKTAVRLVLSRIRKDTSPTVSTHVIKGIRGGQRMEIPVSDDGKTLAFRWCPPGSFPMGSSRNQFPYGAELVKRSPTEIPREAILNQGYWIAETEINAGVFGEGSPGEVVFVSWRDAVNFCMAFNKRNDLNDWEMRLPTEAEWEYACRGGDNTLKWFRKASEHGWFNASQKGKSGQKKPNGWGIYDMRGNLAEWVMDWHDETLNMNFSEIGKYQPCSYHAEENPKGPAIGQKYTYITSPEYLSALVSFNMGRQEQKLKIPKTKETLVFKTDLKVSKGGQFDLGPIEGRAAARSHGHYENAKNGFRVVLARKTSWEIWMPKN